MLLSVILVACKQDDDGAVLGYIQGRYLYVSSTGTGLLFSRYVDRGAEVKQGQLLFRLDPNPELDQLNQAKSELNNAQQILANLIQGSRDTVLVAIMAQISQANADLTYARKTYQRQKSLYRQHAISKATLDASASNYHADQQRVTQLEANLSEAKLGARNHLIKAQQASVQADEANVMRWQWQLAQKTVRAPQSGFVFDTFYKPGELVPAANPVIAILAPDNIRLIFFVPENDLSLLKLGEKVEFSCDACQSTVQAKIYYISPSAEYTPVVLYSKSARQKLVYRVEASLAKNIAIKFHPGQPVDVYVSHKHG